MVGQACLDDNPVAQIAAMSAPGNGSRPERVDHGRRSHDCPGVGSIQARGTLMKITVMPLTVMPLTVMPLFWALLFVPVLRAQQQETAADRKASLDAIKQEFEAAQQACFKAYRKATTDEERRIAWKLNPNGDQFAGRLWPIVDAEPADAVAEDALLWLAQKCDNGSPRAKALGLLLQHHVRSQAIGELCTSLVYEPSKASLDFAVHVAKATPHAAVRGKALWAQAKLIVNALDQAELLRNLTADQRKSAEEDLGADGVAWVNGLDDAASTAASEKIFEELAAKYGDVPLWPERTLADAAKGELFELRNLAIGKTAPDIAGVDADGVAFKLSDYRGKVVVLDFWGFW